MIQENLRNVAIIAHVDHGKTTLVDQMLKQSGAFRANQQVAERVMDSGDIERERGITILAKNCSCEYQGVKINIVDTPGHADFGGEGEPDEPLQMLVSSVDYNDFVGRMGVGRVQNGVIKVGSAIQVCDWHNPDVHMSGRITKLFDFKANGREPIESAQAGDIVAFAGLPDISIGNTICDPSKVQPLPFVKINDPTVEMTFSVNDSPFAGKEGKYVTSRQIRDRLMRELLKDVALKVEDSATNDSFRVMGRGEMHLSILIETMRREGYELQVSPPHVLTHEEDGKVMEPM